MSVLSVLGVALLLTASVDRMAGTNYEDALTLANCAESALELAVRDLNRIPDWNAVLDGTVQSTLIDGPPGGIRAPCPVSQSICCPDERPDVREPIVLLGCGDRGRDRRTALGCQQSSLGSIPLRHAALRHAPSRGRGLHRGLDRR